MTQLVFINNNNQAVTDSLTISEMFGKEHKHVLRDIETQIEKLNEAGELEWGVSNFGQTHYQHPQNKQWYPKYDLTEDGFAIVAMSYTTPEAMKMKVKFIEEFKRMRVFIQEQHVKPLSEKEQLKASMRLSLETSEEVETLKLEVNEVKETVQNIVNTMRIDGGQEAQIRKRGNEAVMQALGGKDANAYKQLSKQVFSAFWRDFKDHFQIPRYGDLPKSRFAEGIKFISMWQPSTSLRMDITTSNGQQHLKLVEGGC